MKKNIILVVSEPATYDELMSELFQQGYELFCARSVQDATDRFGAKAIDLLLIDLDARASQDWTEVARLGQLNPALYVMGLTQRAEVGELFIRAGFSVVAQKPLDVPKVARAIAELLARTPTSSRFRYVPPARESFPGHVPFQATEPGLGPPAYRRWGINE